MKDYPLVMAIYRDRCRRADHLEKIIGISIEVNHRDKERRTAFIKAMEKLSMRLVKKRFALL